MRCLASSGQREEAVRQYFECSRLLMKHLNLSPGAEVQKLFIDFANGADLSGKYFEVNGSFRYSS